MVVASREVVGTVTAAAGAGGANEVIGAIVEAEVAAAAVGSAGEPPAEAAALIDHCCLLCGLMRSHGEGSTWTVD